MLQKPSDALFRNADWVSGNIIGVDGAEDIIILQREQLIVL
jgi:hypothetical protein